jgi:hypothetical protein
MGKGWPWWKPKHDPEAESSTEKKKKKKKVKESRLPMSVAVEVACTLYRERTPCSPRWIDVHLPTSWCLNHRRVPMPLIIPKCRESP